MISPVNPLDCESAMIRFLFRLLAMSYTYVAVIFRLLAMICLCVAVIMAVQDGARSVAASAVTLKPLGISWYEISPDTLNLSQAVIQRFLLPAIWDPFMIWVLNQPGFAVMGILALLLYVAGHKRRRRGRIEKPN